MVRNRAGKFVIVLYLFRNLGIEFRIRNESTSNFADRGEEGGGGVARLHQLQAGIRLHDTGAQSHGEWRDS